MNFLEIPVFEERLETRIPQPELGLSGMESA